MPSANTKVAKTAKNTKDVAISPKMQAFDDAIALMNKTFKSATGTTLLAKLSDRPMNVKTFSTGSVVLDSILGGGFPVGRIIELYGPEASGKTSFALTAAGNVQKEGGTVVFVDLENALDPKYAAKLGVNTDELAVAQPDYAEQALELVEQLAGSGVVDLIVVDSVAALVPKIELEGELEQQNMGVVARLMSRSLKKLVSTANKSSTTVIFINQTRDKIGGFSPYGTPKTTTGGNALKFFASQRIQVTRAGQVKDGKTIIGNEIKLKTVKNKIAPPFGEGITVLTFNKGINRAAEMVEVGDTYDIITRPNNRTYIETATGTVIGTSKGAAVTALEADPEMMERLTLALKTSISEDLFSDKAKNEDADVELEDDELEGDEDN